MKKPRNPHLKRELKTKKDFVVTVRFDIDQIKTVRSIALKERRSLKDFLFIALDEYLEKYTMKEKKEALKLYKKLAT